MTFELDVTDPRAWEKLVERHWDVVDQLLPQIVLEMAEYAEGEMRSIIMERLNKDPTGAMARSVRSEAIEGTDGSPMAMIVGPTVPYGEIQDQGGEIIPHGLYLAVPLPFAGVPRGKWPRDWAPGDLVFVDRGGRSPLLAYVGGGGFEPKYVLKESVVLEGVRYVAATEEATASEAEKILERILEKGGKRGK